MIERLAPTLLDLEVEALLLEVLRDPRSRLFRYTPRQESLAWLELDPRVSQGSPGLTLAERRLLQHHREEVASLLRRAYLESCLEDTGMQRAICLDLGGGRRTETLGRAAIAARARRVHCELGASFSGDHSAGEAKECVEELLLDRSEPLHLLLSSARLVPCDGTRNLFAYEAMRCGNLRLAKEIADRVASDGAEPDHLVQARSCLALIQLYLGRMDRAQQVYAENARAAPDWPNETLSWFALSVQVGKATDALEAGRIIESHWREGDEVVRRWVSQRIEERQDGTWAPTPQSRNLLPGLMERLEAISRMVCLVF